MSGKKRATIVDVAEAAGVSMKTVSRVFNNEPHVRKALKDKVLRAAKALNYQPNVVAQGLVGRRSYLIGLVYENPSPNYVVELQHGALDRLHGERYRLVVLPVESVANVAGKMLGLLRSAALDGVVLTPPASDHRQILDELSESGFPFVRVAPTRYPDIGPSTMTDDVAAACDMTRYLIELGHRDIGLIKGDPTHSATEARLFGFSKALAEAGIAPRLDLIEQGMFTYESGIEAARRLLDRSDRPTAIFAQNDDMAGGAIMAAHELDLDVPRDVSIVGFDDSQIAKVTWPRITTVHQPVYEMARSATDMLVAMLENKPYENKLEHPYELVVRQSAAAPGSSG
ncbi:LacI family DNA-binding transcriptional regulator [Sphingomonas cavernae]|uniref:LacI family DNA-binding transcriptional regulator n=1 Tax=Sphingomonas cavernae TaxID=2320861 RepID=A0A418WLE9_9SPHN|nr:LacI family DNA-binding transcriptional regulator [Sphingomonas cavernae]RJF90830.1 LacI family DNA-binding transcriptional regulator [Sphingomonas cavernae]